MPTTEIKVPTKVTDRKLLQLKQASLKAPKPGKLHPWRGWVSTPAKRIGQDKSRREFLAEARKRAKAMSNTV